MDAIASLISPYSTTSIFMTSNSPEEYERRMQTRDRDIEHDPRIMKPDKTRIPPKLTITKYTEHAQNDTCAICLESFTINDMVSVMKCNHNFHAECLEEWLTKHRSCPLCRRVPNVVPTSNTTNTRRSRSTG